MFSLKRFFEQFKIIWMQNSQKTVLNLGIFALVIIYVNSRLFSHDLNGFSIEFWGFIVAVMTILTSSNIFSSLKSTSSGIHYLMTPATIGEKFSSALVYSSVFTIFVYTVTILLVNNLCILAGNAITGQHLTFLLPSSAIFWKSVLNLLTLQSIFFLGAIVFKKNPFGKTLLCIFLFFIAMGAILTGIASWQFGSIESISSMNITINSLSDLQKLGLISMSLSTLNHLITIILISIPLFFWILAYFRLKTREI